MIRIGMHNLIRQRQYIHIVLKILWFCYTFWLGQRTVSSIFVAPVRLSYACQDCINVLLRGQKCMNVMPCIWMWKDLHYLAGNWHFSQDLLRHSGTENVTEIHLQHKEKDALYSFPISWQRRRFINIIAQMQISIYIIVVRAIMEFAFYSPIKALVTPFNQNSGNFRLAPVKLRYNNYFYDFVIQTMIYTYYVYMPVLQ